MNLILKEYIKNEPQGFTAAKALISRERDGEIEYLIARRVDARNGKENTWPNLWDLLGGRLEKDEGPLDSLHRELWEEGKLSFKSQGSDNAPICIYSGKLQKSDKVQKIRLGVFRIQTDQDLQNEESIQLSSEEHSQKDWVSLDKLITMQERNQLTPVFESLIPFLLSHSS